jgi:hypothetical protein
MGINNSKMEIPKVTFDKNGNLEIVASPTSSKNDFDFYVGNWKLHNRKLKTRLDNLFGFPFHSLIKVEKATDIF